MLEEHRIVSNFTSAEYDTAYVVFMEKVAKILKCKTDVMHSEAAQVLLLCQLESSLHPKKTKKDQLAINVTKVSSIFSIPVLLKNYINF